MSDAIAGHAYMSRPSDEFGYGCHPDCEFHLGEHGTHHPDCRYCKCCRRPSPNEPDEYVAARIAVLVTIVAGVATVAGLQF